MNNLPKLFVVLAVVVSQWPRAAAQSPAGGPPAPPYVWRNVAMN